MIREKCYGDTARLTTPVPLRFRPLPETASAVAFQEHIPKPTNNDGEYTTEEITTVVTKLVNTVQNLERTARSDAEKANDLEEDLRKARNTIAEHEATIRTHESTEENLKKDLGKERSRVHDLNVKADSIQRKAQEDMNDIDRKIEHLNHDKSTVDTQLSNTKDDLTKVTKELEEAKRDLQAAKEARERIEEMHDKFVQSSGDTTNQILEYQKASKRDEQRIQDLEKRIGKRDDDLAKLRRELQAKDADVKQQLEEREEEYETKLGEKLNEQERQYTAQMEAKTDELQQECEQLKALELRGANERSELEAKWTKTLSRVLANSFTGEDIPSDQLYLVLSDPFTSMDNFSPSAVVTYAFVETYTGLVEDVSQVFKDDLRMVELLCWIKGVSLPSDIPHNAIDRIVWLEKHLLKDISELNKREGWVLLAFSLLSHMVVTNSWPACCIAAVRLAVLSTQYTLREKQVWDGIVADLMNRYSQLDVDPLGQACLAYLCLTTSDPPAMMAQNLPTALSQGGFDSTVRIPELVARLEGNRDVTSARRSGALAVVIVRRQEQEVVFSTSSAGWNLSLQPLKISPAADDMNKVIWGPEPEQSIAVARYSEMWSYINRHYKDTLISQTNESTWKNINALIAKYGRRESRPGDA